MKLLKFELGIKTDSVLKKVAMRVETNLLVHSVLC